MNLVDKLLTVDVKKLKEKAIEKFEIKRISEQLGEKFEVTLQEIGTKEYQVLQTSLLDRKGRPDYERVYDTSCKTLLKGVKDPDLKDERLQKHFGAADPLDMIKILFKGEDLMNAASVVGRLSGFDTGTEEEEAEEKEKAEEIKN